MGTVTSTPEKAGEGQSPSPFASFLSQPESLLKLASLIGIVLYGADMIALIAMFSLWAFGVHAFFVFRWFQGQKALKDINDAGVSTF